MVFLKKFYEVDAPVQVQASSIAEAMAKHGTKSDSGGFTAEPITLVPKETENKTQNTEKPKETETGKEAKIADTATSKSATETGKKESPQPKEEVKQETQQKVETPAKQPTLAEVLKQVQPNAVFKAMGMDDDEIAILDDLKGYEKKQYFSQLIKNIKEGKGAEYLKEWTTDYNKMLPEDVMRHQLQKDYPKASPAQLNALYKKEVIEKYNLNSDDEADKAEGIMLLEAQADKYRDSFTENQKQFLTPKAPEPKAAEVAVDEKNENLEAYKSTIDNDPITKDIETTGKITIGEGEDAFKFTVKPDSLKDILYKPDTWTSKFFKVTENADGTKTYTPDTKKQYIVAAYLEYGDDFLKEYANHFKGLGGKAVNDSIDNASKKDGSGASSGGKKQYTSVAEAMAHEGTVNSGAGRY